MSPVWTTQTDILLFGVGDEPVDGGGEFDVAHGTGSRRSSALGVTPFTVITLGVGNHRKSERAFGQRRHRIGKRREKRRRENRRTYRLGKCRHHTAPSLIFFCHTPRGQISAGPAFLNES